MESNSEQERIKSAYKKRKQQLPADMYSCFHDANVYFSQSRDKEILRILKRHSMSSLEKKKILDIGCGTGSELRNFIRYGAKPENLYGIDLLEERVEIARRLSPNINITCSDASEIPYEDESFDIVIQFTVFTSILDDKMKKSISREMIRILKSDGILIWYDYHMNNPKNRDVRGVKKREIYGLFPECQVELKRITLAPPIARLMAPHSTICCHLIEKLTFLNSHYIGVIKK